MNRASVSSVRITYSYFYILENTSKMKASIVYGLWIYMFLGASFAKAQTDFSLKSVTASVAGSSSLHDWESKITKIEFKGSLKTEGNTLKSIKNIEIKIPVKGIKSDEGRIMDRKTFEAFDSDKNPYIIYTLSSAQVKIDVNQMVTIEASGNLTMAGTTMPVTLTSKGVVFPNGDVQLLISKKLKMTDFKMVPPRAMLGTIKVGDEITVKFDLVLTHEEVIN